MFWKKQKDLNVMLWRKFDNKIKYLEKPLKITDTITNTNQAEHFNIYKVKLAQSTWK